MTSRGARLNRLMVVVILARWMEYGPYLLIAKPLWVPTRRAIELFSQRLGVRGE